MTMLSQADLDKLVPAESRMFASRSPCNRCPVTNFCPNHSRHDRNCSKQGSRTWAPRWQSSSAFRAAGRGRWSGEKCDLRRKQRPPVQRQTATACDDRRRPTHALQDALRRARRWPHQSGLCLCAEGCGIGAGSRQPAPMSSGSSRAGNGLTTLSANVHCIWA